ncbi:hypothetical protein Tco_0301904 [Tanacetum coccineum]
MDDKAKNTNPNHEKKGKNKDEGEGSRNDMVKYFKEQWEIDRNKEAEEENENIEDVLENNTGIAKELGIKEMEGMDTTILH